MADNITWSAIYLGNLPNHLGVEQVKELVSMFGELKAFHLLMCEDTHHMSKGIAFLEYEDPGMTQVTRCAMGPPSGPAIQPRRPAAV